MADTTNLGITKPTVGADTDTWGGIVNTGLDDIDAVFAAAGSGTSVGLNVGAGKTLTVAGTLTASGTTTLAATTLGGTVAGGGNQLNNVVVGAVTPLAGSFTDASYTGTLTGGTGVVNIGSGQVYKDASGNVGINTSAPARTLHVKAGGVTTLANSNGALFTDAGNAGVLLGSDNVLGYISGVDLAGTAVKDLVLQPFGGNVMVGTTSPLYSIPNGVAASGSSIGVIVVGHASGVTSGNGFINFNYNTGAIGSITQNGTTGVSYNTSSDYRLKEDWVAVANASTRVNALKPINFAWISSGERVDGFLAHELADVVPEAVTGTKDAMRDEEYEVTPAVLDDEGAVVTPAVMGTRSVPDYQGIDQSKLVPLLTAALQEALAAIDDLTARVSALEGN